MYDFSFSWALRVEVPVTKSVRSFWFFMDISPFPSICEWARTSSKPKSINHVSNIAVVAAPNWLGLHSLHPSTDHENATE